MARFSTALLFMVGLAAAAGCGDSMPDTRALPLTLETIEFRDPDADFEQAVEHGEVYFVAIHEFTTIIPGLSNDCPQHDLIAEFGSETIEGTSDYAASRAEGQLNDMARTYAERYNRLIVAHLQKHDDERVRRLATDCS